MEKYKRVASLFADTECFRSCLLGNVDTFSIHTRTFLVKQDINSVFLRPLGKIKKKRRRLFRLFRAGRKKAHIHPFDFSSKRHHSSSLFRLLFYAFYRSPVICIVRSVCYEGCAYIRQLTALTHIMYTPQNSPYLFPIYSYFYSLWGLLC